MKKCLIVCGPTASGKTAVGIELAKKYDTAILSADSRQCYREMDIGVARPSQEELSEVKHYFIASHSIEDNVTVKDYEDFALKVLGNLFESNDYVIVVGGTGLYIKALAEGLDEIPAAHPGLRTILETKYLHNGFEWLYQEVQMLDPLFYEKGEMQNPRRLLRALEVILTTGKSIIEYQSNSQKARPFKVEYLFLNPAREQLYQQINNRVDEMIARGLVGEAEGLYRFKNLKALQTVGYQEIFDYMDGKFSLDTAIGEIKKNTRRYAKRQITWFKKYTY